MSFAPISRLADALLYEGYLLYPYRATSVKNQYRFTIGCLLPPAWPQAPGSAERAFLQTECLVLGNAQTHINVVARFLHLLTQIDGGTPTWPDAITREIETPIFAFEQLLACSQEHEFAFIASRQIDGTIVRSQQALAGTIVLSAQRCAENAFKLSVRLENHTPISDECRTREEALAWSLLSSHLLLGVREGEFLSMLDPPPALRDATEACRNVGVFPVLAGNKARPDTMLAAPIALDDYPRIAPASPGDLFDGTEIDEILTLRIQTLTDAEKHEAARLDPRAKQILERCETLANDQFLDLHGSWARDQEKATRIRIGSVDFALGMRVRLQPQGRADPFDLTMAGMTGVIVSIEQDFEDQLYVSVVLDDDTGRDLGLAGKPGHRFFFRPEEVEPLGEDKVKG